MTPKKLPYKKFLESFKFAPRPAVNLVIEEDGAVLLTKRKKSPFAGFWHLPGSFILKGESLMECVRRVAKEELGVAVENVKLAGAFDDIAGDPRGHVVDLVYRCHVSQGPTFQPVGDTAEIKFFKKLPDNMGFNHRETLRKLGYR